MLELDQVSAARAGSEWLIRWRIRNPDDRPVEILSAWLPHSRFRGREWRLDSPLRVPAGGEAVLDSAVAWDEPPGAVVENGFLILRLEGGSRVFARLRIISRPDGSPHAVCENVTSQPAS